MTIPTNTAENLILALDALEISEVFSIVEKLPKLRWVKVGLELFLKGGPQIVVDLRKLGLRVFLDLKFHDIPETMKRACFQAASTGAELISVHAAAGKKALLESQKAAVEGALAEGFVPPKLLAVTVLTSWSKEAFAQQLLINQPIEMRVKLLASLAHDAGLGGCICSPLEVNGLRNSYPKPFELVTPGIRSIRGQTDDQERVMTPSSAIKAGASKIVIGRPITQANDPIKMFDIFYEDLAKL